MTPDEIRKLAEELDARWAHSKREHTALLLRALADVVEATNAHIFAPSTELKTHQQSYLKLRIILARVEALKP